MFSITIFVSLCFVGALAAPSEDRIVGGVDAEAGEYPYIVSLKNYGSHSCGGSILSEKYVLTAAHCISGSENYPQTFQIQYGVLEIASLENIIQVKKIIKNPNYTPGGGYENDVAILELTENIKFSETAQPVQLPSSDDYPGDNATAILVGWGRDGTGVIRNHLQKVEIILFTNEFCESKENNYNKNTHVCAGIAPGGKGQCNGDSGGPLTVNGKQYGVVSWSVKPCTSRGHPGVFAKVTSYRSWIQEITGI